MGGYADAGRWGRNWFHTLKGAESFLDDADKGKLPAKAVVPQDFNSVENLLKRTKEQVLCSAAGILVKGSASASFSLAASPTGSPGGDTTARTR